MRNCPFCRTCYLYNDVDTLKMAQARAEKKDPAAIEHLGGK